MPFYDYQAIDADESCETCREPFERMQKRSEPKLTECPDCGAAVERLLNGVGVGKSKALAKKHLEKAGFTQYSRAGKGEYERTSGSGGPDAIVRNDGT